jgi:translation initiation factor IF-2
MTFTNESEAKYVVYASRDRKNKIKIPRDSTLIKNTVEDYENYLDQLLHDIKKDYLKKINNGKNLSSVSNEIFKKLNLTRL